MISFYALLWLTGFVLSIISGAMAAERDYFPAIVMFLVALTLLYAGSPFIKMLAELLS